MKDPEPSIYPEKCFSYTLCLWGIAFIHRTASQWNCFNKNHLKMSVSSQCWTMEIRMDDQNPPSPDPTVRPPWVSLLAYSDCSGKKWKCGPAHHHDPGSESWIGHLWNLCPGPTRNSESTASSCLFLQFSNRPSFSPPRSCGWSS